MQLKQLDDRIDQDYRALDELRQLAFSIGSVDYSRQRVRTSLPSSSPFEDAAAKLCAASCALDKEIDEYVDLKRLITGQIRHLENEISAGVLYRRYVEYKPLEVIADEMGYSYSHLRHLHGRALEEFERRYLQGEEDR